MMRRVAVVVAALLAVAAPAAARPAAVAPALAGPFGDVRLGGQVTFDATYPRQPGAVIVRVQVVCRQNAAVVYAEAGPVDHTFTLGGPGTDWATSGGPADCLPTLWAWRDQRRQQVVMWSVSGQPFTAAG